MLPNQIYSLPAPLFLQLYNEQELEMNLYDIISILLLGLNRKMGCPISKLCVILMYFPRVNAQTQLKSENLKPRESAIK